MEITAAILAEYANVHYGSLVVAGAPVTRILRPVNEVRPLPVTLALVMEVGPDPEELAQAHTLRVTVVDHDNAREMGVAVGAFQVPEGVRAELRPGQSVMYPAAVTLRPVPIPQNGVYDVRVSVDGGCTTIRTVYIDPMAQGAE